MITIDPKKRVKVGKIDCSRYPDCILRFVGDDPDPWLKIANTSVKNQTTVLGRPILEKQGRVIEYVDD